MLLRASFSSLRHCALQRLQVSQDQLGLDDLDIGAGIDLTGHVGDVVVGEHPDHLADGVAFADVGQELVAEPGTLGRALDEAGDVDERHRRRDDALGCEKLRQLVQSRIGQRNDALVRFDRRERIVGRHHVVPGQRVEQRRLADVGQAHDSQAQAHGEPSLGLGGGGRPPWIVPAHRKGMARPGSLQGIYGRFGPLPVRSTCVSTAGDDRRWKPTHRSIHPNIPGVPWWAALLIAVTTTAIGYAIDAGSGHKELTTSSPASI